MRPRPLLSTLFAVGLALCFRAQEPSAATDSNRFLAERIAAFGHGRLVDQDGREIRVSAASISAMQAAILAEVTRARPERISGEAGEALERARRLLQKGDLPPAAAILLRSGIISRLLHGAPASLLGRYAWRNEALLSAYRVYDLDSLRVVTIEIKGLFETLVANLHLSTRYMDDCRAQAVPIPPNWAEKGTPWQLQGSLTNDLFSGLTGDTLIWTYSDPKVRGACIALMRGVISPVKLGAFICQSATTGHACFWENISKFEKEGDFIDWRGGTTLVINQLKDGSNLGPCTHCHRGNNAFLISPDDPTWARVLRGPLNGPSTGTFTTRVEKSIDNQGGHPRYIPMSTVPPSPAWQNTYNAEEGCWGACHEKPKITPPPMPPDCALPSTTNPSNCYGTP